MMYYTVTSVVVIGINMLYRTYHTYIQTWDCVRRQVSGMNGGFTGMDRDDVRYDVFVGRRTPVRSTLFIFKSGEDENVKLN